MENCLVQKLKSVVDNDKLPILGKLKIKVLDVTSTPAARNFSFRFTEKAVTIDATGDIHFTDKTLEEDYGQTKTGDINQYDTYGYISTGTGFILVPKYILTHISTQRDFSSTRNFVYNVSDLASCPSLISLEIMGAVLSEPLDALAKLNLTKIDLGFGKVIPTENFDFVKEMTSLTDCGIEALTEYNFPIMNFAKLVNLTRLFNRYANSLKGVLEDFCKAMCGYGRTSGTLVVTGGSLSFNSVIRGGGTIYTINFTDTGCELSITNGISGTYNKSSDSWTYTS